MLRACPAAVLVAIVACGDGAPPRASTEATGPAPAPVAAAAVRCELAPFADHLPVPEASGAARIDLDGRAALLVVGDSGTRGAYVIADAVTGEVLEEGRLPLGDGAGDDLEGISLHAGRLTAITSAGWLRAWRRVAGGFELVDGPYPIAEVDASLPRVPRLGGLGAAPTNSMACDGHGVNCGKNYEALCLDPGAPAGACAGWAGAKADGRLWCLVADPAAPARLRADPTRSIEVAPGDALSGCDVAVDGAVWVATNAFDHRVYRVTGARAPSTARGDVVDVAPGVFPEAIAVGPDGLWRLDDLGRAPSPATRWTCAEFAPPPAP